MHACKCFQPKAHESFLLTYASDKLPIQLYFQCRFWARDKTSSKSTKGMFVVNNVLYSNVMGVDNAIYKALYRTISQAKLLSQMDGDVAQTSCTTCEKINQMDVAEIFL